MNVLLAVQKELRDRFSAAFSAAGATVTTVVDPELLGAVDGQCGAFTYRLDGQPGSAELVVLAGSAYTDPLLSDDKAFSARLEGQRFDQPLAIVLDIGGQSPPGMTGAALRRAVQAVSRKRSAVIFAKDVRTSDSGDELLYRQARQAGVAVIRYKTLEITSKDGIYNVRSSDGFTDISVKTRWVIKASANIPPEIDAFAGRLRLKKSAGSDTAGRYWLNPVFTSRKGVYYIDASLLPEAGLEGVAQGLIRSVAFADGDNAAHAHIDPLKCAFCYTCFRACPHAALAPDTAASSILVLETMCDACGICVALCPANAIELQESTASRSGAERGALKIIACENSAYYAAMTALGGSPQDYGVCVESVPCCGSVTGRQITSALQDFDAVLVAACMEDACRHFDGNIRGCVHTKRLIEDMARLGLNDNVAFYNASASMAGPLKLEIDRLLGISAGNIDIREG